jgi:hypothetical protein
LVLDEHRFGHHSTGAAGTGEPGDGCQQVQKKNGQIAHRTILPTSWTETFLKNLGIRHAQADFQSGSYGYRPRQSAHAAVRRVSKAILQGKTYVIDLDLKSYFDTVRHHIVLAKVASRVRVGSWA